MRSETSGSLTNRLIDVVSQILDLSPADNLRRSPRFNATLMVSTSPCAQEWLHHKKLTHPKKLKPA